MMTGRDDVELKPVLLSGTYAIMKSYTKPYASCRYTHPSVEAAIHLREKVRSEEIEGVDIRTYRVIYDALNDVQAAIKGMLAPKFKEKVIGHVEIRKVIPINKALIAGAYVKDGKITRTAKVRLIRDGIVIHEGELDSLRRFKDDVKEVAASYECGLTLQDYRDIREGDQLEVYVMEEVAAE